MKYACHWDYVQGPPHGGRPTRVMVWICEYPYRTVRSGPCDDCEGCLACRAPQQGQDGRNEGNEGNEAAESSLTCGV